MTLDIVNLLRRARIRRTCTCPRYVYLNDETHERLSDEAFNLRHVYLGSRIARGERITMLLGAEVLPGEHLGGIDILFSDRGDL